MIDIGSVVNGKYRLVRILGDGGMGSVYEALHTALGTRVAVKVLHPDLVRRTGLVERFLQEARVAAQIRSPHVVQVMDVDRTADGHAYIVMELLEGEALSSVLDRQHKLPVSTACEYTIQILEALEAAHALGVIHRDLKPENVFVTYAAGKPVLKLIDFGIAKAKRVDARQKNLTVAGVVMGTAEYMAPEQARSADKVDPRADLYAVGVLLYEMIAGARPVRGDSGADARVIALKVERGEVVPLVQAAPATPRDVAGLVHRAMAARPEMRFASATEMRLAIEGALGGKRQATNARALQAAPSSGTIAMPAPAQSTAAVGARTGGPLAEAPPDTVRAAPIATALAPMGYSASRLGAAFPAEQARARRGIPIAAIVGLSLLLAASVGGILVGTGTWVLSSGAAEPVPSVGPPVATITPPASASIGAPASAVATAPAAITAVPTLIPPKPAAVPKPLPSVRPLAQPDTGAPPFALPTSLPPFPTGFGLPAGFPSTLPSGFPTALPSGFPSALPGWPPLPLPLPTPTQAPSPSSGY